VLEGFGVQQLATASLSRQGGVTPPEAGHFARTPQKYDIPYPGTGARGRGQLGE